MANVIPSDAHAVTDPAGHTTDHNNAADVLGLLAATVALQGNSDSAVTSPPGGNASAVTALQNMLTHRAGYYPWLFSVVAYGAAGDGQMAVDGAVSTGTPTTLTCATSAPFKAGDVGKAVIVNGVLGTGSAGTGTISAFTSSSVVTVTWLVTPTTTVTGACVLWGTDDTTAFQNCINAAASYISSGGNAEVYRPFPPGGIFYMIAGPLVNTGNANAQLVITNPSSVVGTPQGRILFSADVTRSLPLWTQTAFPQVHGGVVSTGVFASTGANSTNQGTFQNACVIGTVPNFATLNANILGFPAFENIHVIFEDWTIVTPSSANGINYTAFSLAGSAKGEFWNCAALVTTNYNNSSGSNAFPATGTLANGTSTGFILPGNGNNDCCILDNCISSGYAYGRQLAEHAVVKGGANIGCWASFKLMGNDGAGGGHLIKIMAASTELCTTGFYVFGSGTTGFTIDADIDVEGISNNSMLLDNNSGAGLGSLLGEIRVYGNCVLASYPPAYPVYLKLRAVSVTVPGWVFGYAGFSAAGTTVAVPNPYWRHPRAHSSGGTLTPFTAGVTPPRPR